MLAKTDAKNYAALGGWYASHQQFGCAAGAYKKLAALEPDSAQNQYLLGFSLYADGKAIDALAPLKRSLTLDPGTTQTRVLLASALDASGDRRGAELQWRLALAKDPNSPLALESLSRDLRADHNHSAVIALLHPLDSSGKLTDKLGIDLAAAYSDAALPEEGAALLQKRLKGNPSSLELAEALSGVLILEGRFQEATAVLSPIAKQHLHDVQAQVLVLQTMVLAHDPGAEAFGRTLLASAPNHGELLYFLGVLRQQADDYSGARDYYERSIAADPASADAHYRLGIVLSALKNESAAKGEFERAVALGLNTPEVHIALAKAMRSLGDAPAAQHELALYRVQLQLQASRAQAADKAQQGDQAAAASNLKQAAEDYRAAFALDPKEPVLAYKLAMALDKTGDHAGERAALQQAVELDQHMAAALNQIGYLDASDGDAEAATHHFQLAIEADPAFSRAWMNLAASFCLQSKWADARDALQHVIALDGDSANAHALLQQIDGMEAQAGR